MTSFDTRAIHVGQRPDPTTGDVVPPIHVATTYVSDKVGVPDHGYEYARAANPTRDAFQRALADLEGGEGALAFPAGMSAEDTVTRALTRPGDHITFGADVYGGTFRLFTIVAPAEGRTSTPLDARDLAAVEADLAANHSRFVWVETPSNPLLQVVDLLALADLAHAHGALLVVDNTFATPVLQRPIELGADIVVHSTTKYIGGHSDVLGGAAVVREGLRLPDGLADRGWSGTDSVLEELHFLQNAVGSVQSPVDVHLLHRGLKTLPLRVRAQSANALAVAQFLAAHPGVQAVHYPGLPGDPGHDLAATQMTGGFGGVVSFDLGTAERAQLFATSTKLFALAVSLGAAESLVEYPGVMTHGVKADQPGAIPPGLIRLAIGLEDPEDLVADLEQALAAVDRV